MAIVTHRRAFLVVVCAAVVSGAGPASVQAQAVGGSRPEGEDQSSGQRWRLRAGPLAIAPYIRLGQIALDTNVFYTAEERTTDLTASGGPGLRIDVPMGRVVPFVDGNVNYYWFARTKEERRFGGGAGGGFDWNAGAFRMGASRYFVRTYERPSFEVDRRVLRDEWQTRVHLDVDAGARFRIEPRFSVENREVPAGFEYLGSDLSRSLTENRSRLELGLIYGLTSKTDFVVLLDQEWSRFPKDVTRDADSNRLAGGFALQSQTRLGGRAIGGIRLFRPKGRGRGAGFTRPYAEARLEWILGGKTRLSAEYTLDTQYSAFGTESGALPTVATQNVGVRFFRRIGRRIEFNADGRLMTLKNDTPVVVRRRGSEQTVIRDDQSYGASADLGFRIRERLRLGVMATYNERQSNFADFGVDGLLLGASIRFNP